MIDSRWYYGVIAIMGLEIVGFGLIGVASLGSVDPATVSTGLLGAGLVVVSLLLLPVFAACLYFDAKAVEEANESWDPNPKIWAIGAVGVQIAAIAAGATLYLFIGTWYLFRRFRSSPAAIADEEAWAEQEARWEEEETSTGEP